MKAAKILLLLAILGFGGTVETAWRVRNHISGPWSWDFGGGRFRGPSFSFEAAEAQPVDAGTAVEVENSFGGVKVHQGAPGEVTIGLRKVVYRPTEEKAHEFAARVALQKNLGPGVLRITTNRDEVENAIAPDRVGLETHLDVTVPPGTVVKVRNDHGSIAISDVAEARVWGAHDDVRVERVAGAATLETRHGDVVASAIGGSLSLDAQHGSVDLQKVSGKATVSLEHGDLSASGVGGLSLTQRHGELSADGVQGDLEVRAEHSEIRAANITGKVDVETSHRDITVQKVAGDARLRARHGHVTATDVKGRLDVESSYDNVQVTRAGGPVEIVVTNGGVEATGLESGGRIRASGEGVDVEGFRGGLEVECERGDVRLVPDGPLTEPVKVTATRAGIELVVPAGSRFVLDASSRGGEVSADVEGLAVSLVHSSRVEGSLGGGGNSVVLRSERGDVRVLSASASGSAAGEKPAKDE